MQAPCFRYTMTVFFQSMHLVGTDVGIGSCQAFCKIFRKTASQEKKIIVQ